MRGRVWQPGRQTPKVKKGKVQKKHRWDYYVKEYNVDESRPGLTIIREPAIRRFRHLVSEQDLRKFIALIPDWKQHSAGLKGIVLGDGDDNCYGWSDVDFICIHAWDSDITQVFNEQAFLEDKASLDRLMITHSHDVDGYTIEFTTKSAQAYLLTNVLLHELGHHVDRMRSKAQTYATGGEKFAQDFADRVAEQMWPKFSRAFRY